MTNRSQHPLLNMMLLAAMFGYVGWARLCAEPIPVRIRAKWRP